PTLLLVLLGEPRPVGTLGNVVQLPVPPLVKRSQLTLKPPESRARRITWLPALSVTPLLTVVQFCQPPVEGRLTLPLTFAPSISTCSVPPVERDATRASRG